MEESYNYNYQSERNNVFTLLDNKKRTIVNALCITETIKHASLELGISEKAIYDFMSKHNIKKRKVDAMRNEFALSKIKIKLQYVPIPNSTRVAYRKNSEI
tara:strand:- start:1177 stop:1479 length:303 start_codon:yes stop_codon:yes gene_type:complete